LAGPQLALRHNGRCILVNMFAAMESFLGVLFAGVAGAIILGKIMRYNAIAPVTWSDPVVLKYGSGVKVKVEREQGGDQETDEKRDDRLDDNGDDDDDEGSVDCETGGLPFPILEFRVANHAFAQMEAN
jgi:hypothetical protein